MEQTNSVFESDSDHFNGVIVKPRHYGQITAEDFHRRLTESLAKWKESGKRGVWLTIPLDQSELISVAAKVGFEFHHAKPDRVTMTQWLPKEQPSTLPIYATHNIGVAGVVVNSNQELLVVQEKWLRGIHIAHWKLPGGVCDPGENLWQTAIRETFEETGIRTEFVSLLTFRHMHDYKWGIDDMYFACLLRPLNLDIKINPDEIAAGKWVNVDEYLADSNTFPTNKFIIESYKEGLKTGFMVQPTVLPHFLPSKPDMAHYRIRSCDPAKLCDLERKEWSWSLKKDVEELFEPKKSNM